MLKLIVSALQEDGYNHDVTTMNLVDKSIMLSGNFVAKANGIVSGVDVAEAVFKYINPKIKFTIHKPNGSYVNRGSSIATISGPMRDILRGERIALNFMQRMSGIATVTNQFVQEVKGTNALILDTRKTTPGFRAFEKYSVKVGGGALHRFNLSDCAMIKDNHIQVAGSVTNAVKLVKANLSHAHKIELECDTLEQIKEALPLGVDIIMLDNMTLEQMKEAVELINHRATVEASGNVHLDTVRKIAECGVDIISSSAIVAKAPTLDVALDM